MLYCCSPKHLGNRVGSGGAFLSRAVKGMELRKVTKERSRLACFQIQIHPQKPTMNTQKSPIVERKFLFQNYPFLVSMLLLGSVSICKYTLSGPTSVTTKTIGSPNHHPKSPNDGASGSPFMAASAVAKGPRLTLSSLFSALSLGLVEGGPKEV